MPLYEYECLKCGERFERIQKFSDDLLKMHTEHAGSPCDGEVRKLLSAPAIQFKGSGWYVTDYGKGGERPAQDRDKSPKDGSDVTRQKDAKASGSQDSSTKVSKPPAKDGGSAVAASAS